MTIHHQQQQQMRGGMALEKSRVMLYVKIPELSSTKKILFDQVESIIDAINLINEKLPPNSLERPHEFNIYIPSKGRWCVTDTPFTKYQFKDNQEIEYKRDTRSGVSHLLSSVGQRFKQSRTVQIYMPEIIPLGMSHSHSNSHIIIAAIQDAAITESLPTANNSVSAGQTISPSTPTTPSPLRNSSDNNTFAYPYPPSSGTPSSLPRSSNAINISMGARSGSAHKDVPRLNLTPLSGSYGGSSQATMSSSPGRSGHLGTFDPKKFFNLFGISAPRSTSSSSPRKTSPTSTHTSTTPRNIGTVCRSTADRISVDSIDFDDQTTVKDVLHKIYQRWYGHLDRELLDDYNLLLCGPGGDVWLSERSRTLADYSVHHMSELRFARQHQRLKVTFLNREVLLAFSPTDTIAQITQQFKANYLPNLIRTHRPSASSGTLSKLLRQYQQPATLEQLVNEQATLSAMFAQSHPHLTRQQRSFSDSPTQAPLSFSRHSNPLNSTEHAIDTIKRKNTLVSTANPLESLTVAPDSLASELAEFRDFRLHLCIKHPNPNIQSRYDLLLEDDRTLESFHFWNNVKLHFKQHNASSMHTNPLRYVAPHQPCQQPFYLTVESPGDQLSASYMMEVEATSRVSDVLSSYSKLLISNPNIKLNDCLDEYGLYIDTTEEGKEGIEYGQSVLLDSNRTLASYPIEQLDKLLFKRTNNCLGIDPSTIMDYKLDASCSLKVPSELVQLKQKLRHLNGFKEEGVFKMAASEASMQAVSNALSCNELLSTIIDVHPSSSSSSSSIKGFGQGEDIDVHAVANYIKRWYLRLPTRVLAGVDEEQLREAATNEDAAVQMMKSLQEPYSTLLQWLSNLLSEVSYCAATNRMNAKSLAVAMSHILLPSSNSTSYHQDGANESSSSLAGGMANDSDVHGHGHGHGHHQQQIQQQYANVILQHLITHSLKEQGYIAHSGSSFSISFMTSSHSSVSPTTSSLISGSPSINDLID
ncbi:hypothetical protein SAMD00019534_062520 [Acytostelium subglobosum LB1]|uniref:hypothetical protein n=1 Tax=Acytostelium subglobosum LB1 TaxID=1410327 RepID=UPI000644FAC1|nr:hypothetical protein SAMD00019534_062520 [Acytostelium subglobosum LB1]GAM23077.1 hypothetical protein SAMD00019534_062520 [Acytostelium subglobosum LB1]|eukprot:XP_012754304.1 hypothetical protein SAMD00019534_062520 [Acytostelium subglobosum LB1]